jgi:hypothetical protein
MNLDVLLQALNILVNIPSMVSEVWNIYTKAHQQLEPRQIQDQERKT